MLVCSHYASCRYAAAAAAGPRFLSPSWRLGVLGGCARARARASRRPRVSLLHPPFYIRRAGTLTPRSIAFSPSASPFLFSCSLVRRQEPRLQSGISTSPASATTQLKEMGIKIILQE